MILSVTDGKETYEIKLDSLLRDLHSCKQVNVLMLTNSSGEGISLDDSSLFRMVDEYFKKYY